MDEVSNNQHVCPIVSFYVFGQQNNRDKGSKLLRQDFDDNDD